MRRLLDAARSNTPHDRLYTVVRLRSTRRGKKSVLGIAAERISRVTYYDPSAGEDDLVYTFMIWLSYSYTMYRLRQSLLDGGYFGYPEDNCLTRRREDAKKEVRRQSGSIRSARRMNPRARIAKSAFADYAYGKRERLNLRRQRTLTRVRVR